MKITFVFIIALLISACSSLSHQATVVNCLPAYKCESSLVENQEIQLIKDNFGQAYISTTTLLETNVFQLQVLEKMELPQVQDVKSTTYYFNFSRISSKTLESLRVFKSVNCKCPEQGLEEIKLDQVQLKSNLKDTFLVIAASNFEFLENNLKIKL